MAARHVLLASAGVFLNIFSGCKHGAPSPAAPSQVNSPPAGVSTPAATEAIPDSPELVARRAERYAADLEAALVKRDAREKEEQERLARERLALPATAPVITPVSGPSAVQWTEPAPPASAVVTPASAVVTPVAPAPLAPQPVIIVPPVAAPSVAVSNAGATVAVVSPAAPSSDLLERTLRQKLRDNPRDASAQLDWQLLQFVRERPAPDLQAMAGLPDEDREVLSAVLDGLSNFRAGVRNDNNMMLSKKIQPLIQSAERLRSQAELHLSTVQLCTRVEGFGVYEPIDPPRFPAGKEGQAVLYTEVANFASQLNDKSKWETKLTHSAVLYTESGMQVCEEKVQTIEDKSRNRRTDFFVVRVVKFPPTLTIGRYLLKVTVTDLQANRVAETTVPVTVVGKL